MSEAHPEKSEAELVAERVREWGPTEDDEEAVLESLGYVLNEETGIYEGEGHSE